MKVKTAKLAVIAFMLTCALAALLLTGKTSSDESDVLSSTGLGSVESLEANYRAWEAEYIQNGGDRNMTIGLASSEKGITDRAINAGGFAKLNWIDGIVSVEVNGLEKARSWDVWLLDNSADSPVTPDETDSMVKVGTLEHKGKAATLEATLGPEAFATFEPDLVVVTESGKSPIESRVLAGGTTLFHALYRSAQRGQFGVVTDQPQVQTAREERSLFQRVIDAISPTAEAQIGPIPNPTTALQQLITAGRQSFFNDTFQGNGRTCGTCHREDENLTITPEFIAGLPPNDPLFVAEFVPALANNFENPVLMRKLGLILENVDGFGDLANRFAMRGVPHTLALLPNTLLPALADGTTMPPNERTGWGGDGAPVGTFSTPSGTLNATGTLRDFIIGAIIQHYPKTLARQNGVDFILATTAQLNALEAFMKSAGRRADLVLSGPGALRLRDTKAALGQRIFNNPSPLLAPLGVVGDPTIGAGSCFLCHLNAGASDFFEPGRNANFNTNVESLPSQPADLLVPPSRNPPDGGFGGGPGPTGGLGNGTFNTPVVVEAADTPPFFHNNAITTIEGAVDFYNSDAFNRAPGFGGVLTGDAGLINLAATEVESVAAFLRVINALENIRSSLDLENRAKNATSFSQAQELLKLSIAELDDAIDVLKCGGLHLDARQKLLEAAVLDGLALLTPNESLRDALISQAIQLKAQARNLIRF
jgi:hypothetical protein